MTDTAPPESGTPPTGRLRARLRRLGVGCLGLLVILAVVFALGPRVTVDATVADPPAFADQPLAEVEQWVADRESRVADIVPGAEAMIRWQSDPPTKTPVSIVYFHGFSASRPEISPVMETVADELGANVYFVRLAAHGQVDGVGFKTAVVNDWLQDAVDAAAVGRAIGDRVILAGLSTGALFPVWLAVRDQANIEALLLLSPNFSLRDKRSEMMRWPWGEQIVRGIKGDFHRFRTINELHARYWTEQYPVEGLLQLMALVDHVRNLPLESIRVPVLTVFTPHDQICDPADMIKSHERYGSARKELVEFGEAKGHILAGDILCPECNQSLIAHLLRFLRGNR